MQEPLHQIDTIPLHDVTRTKEWYEGKYLFPIPQHLRLTFRAGYEELKAIPSAFVLEFQREEGERERWGIYVDNEHEKDRLLGVLHSAIGV